jgi:hypothetical protein
MKKLLSPWINDNGIYFRFISGENPYLAKNRVCLIDKNTKVRIKPLNLSDAKFQEEFNWKEISSEDNNSHLSMQTTLSLCDAELESMEYLLMAGHDILPIALFKTPESQYNDLPSNADVIISAQGGEWLGKARELIKWNFRGGDTCTWGSNEILNIEVVKIEEFAANVCLAGITEYKSKLKNGL